MSRIRHYIAIGTKQYDLATVRYEVWETLDVVIVILALSQEPVTSAERIRDLTGLGWHTVRRVLETLQQRGLTMHARGLLEDGRTVGYGLTPKGAQQVSLAASLAVETDPTKISAAAFGHCHE